MYATTKLGIADMLAHGPRSVESLAEEAGVDENALYRTLRFLAMLGVYHEVGLRHFKLTPASEFLRSDHPQSVRSTVVWLANPFHLRTYAELLHSVRTGEPCVEQVTKMPVFEYFGRDVEVATEFNDAMTNISETALPPVLEAYDFSGIGTLVDVAGGHGTVCGRILQRYPEMRGIVYDLEVVTKGTPKRLRELGVAARCQVVAGDMFKSVPAGDSFVMKHIIHDWDEARCLTILKNCIAAMNDKKNGRIILIEAVVKGPNEPDFAKLMDIEMLAMPGGQERTEQEYEELFDKAGLEMNIVPTQGPLWVIEGRVR